MYSGLNRSESRVEDEAGHFNKLYLNCFQRKTYLSHYILVKLSILCTIRQIKLNKIKMEIIIIKTKEKQYTDDEKF